MIDRSPPEYWVMYWNKKGGMCAAWKLDALLLLLLQGLGLILLPALLLLPGLALLLLQGLILLPGPGLLLLQALLLLPALLLLQAILLLPALLLPQAILLLQALLFLDLLLLSILYLPWKSTYLFFVDLIIFNPFIPQQPQSRRVYHIISMNHSCCETIQPFLLWENGLLPLWDNVPSCYMGKWTPTTVGQWTLPAEGQWTPPAASKMIPSCCGKMDPSCWENETLLLWKMDPSCWENETLLLWDNRNYYPIKWTWVGYKSPYPVFPVLTKNQHYTL